MDFFERISHLDRKPFQDLKKLLGHSFYFDFYSLHFERIQGSPGAHPASIAVVTVSCNETGFNDAWFISKASRLALKDFIIRRFHEGIKLYAKQNRGEKGSGSFHTIELTQAILCRDSIKIEGDRFSLWFIISFPSRSGYSGSLDAEQASIMFSEELPAIVQHALVPKTWDASTLRKLEEHIGCVESWVYIQKQLKKRGLIAFVKDGSILPRRSGDDDRPMECNAVPFQSPESLRVSFELPTGKTISGMGIPEGIVAIIGGGFHGKSTLMQALSMGVYPHIPGDGREVVVTRSDTVYIEAEEGRCIHDINIHPFIHELPRGKNTKCFSTTNASGSTSQAASIVEAIESGAQVLLFDEDTCATNLLMRDETMEKILPSSRDPIKPLLKSVRSLWIDHGISTVFIVGGLGEFLKHADVILLMDKYKCFDITVKVRKILGPPIEPSLKLSVTNNVRYLASDNFDPSFCNDRMNKVVEKRIKPLRRKPRTLEYGNDLIELNAIRQIDSAPQVQTIGFMLYAIRLEMQRRPDKVRTVCEWLDWLEEQIKKSGIEGLKVDYRGLHALPTRYAVAAAINRTRSLKTYGSKES